MKRWVTNLGLLQIFCSLLLVILIMFVSTYSIYRNSIAGIYDQVTQNNHLAVQSIVQSYDNSFRTIDYIIHSIHTLPPYDNLVAVDNKHLDMLKVQSIVENLSALISSVEFVEEVVVFYDFSDLAITSKGTSDFRLLFNNKYRHDSYNANFWRSYSLTKHAFKLFPADRFEIYSETTRQSNMAELMVAVASNKVEISSKRIMAIINMDVLMKHVNQQPMIPGASLIVLDQERNVIYSTEEQLNLMDILNDVYFNSDNEASMTRGNYKYSFYRSAYNDFIYIDKVPYQFQNLDSVAIANRMIMISTIICAILLSGVLSVYLYKPVRRIVRQLNAGSGHGKERGNDFRRILDGVAQLQHENVAYKEKMSSVDPVARRSAFLQAVDPYMPAEQHERFLRLYFEGFFKYKHFALALIQLYEHADADQPSWAPEPVTRALQAQFDKGGWTADVFYEKNARWIVWVGLNHIRERELLLKRLRSMILSLEQGDVQAGFLRASVSGGYDSDVFQIARAYREVVNGTKYRSADGAVKVQDVLEIDGGRMMSFQLDNAERLANYAMNGRWDQVKAAISEMMQRSGAGQMNLHELAHIARTLFYSMLNQAARVSGRSKELQKLEMDFMQQIEQAYNGQAMEQALLQAADLLARQPAADAAERTDKPDAAYILRYIDQHHAEDLNLDQLGEMMGISPKYFSHYFKKTFGVNFVEHLNRVRLSHAKRFLEETALTVAEISEKTGYLNYSTFTNTFKKYYGISPSEYRKQKEAGSNEGGAG